MHSLNDIPTHTLRRQQADNWQHVSSALFPLQPCGNVGDHFSLYTLYMLLYLPFLPIFIHLYAQIMS